jgi:myo-inositol-1(or 4)-monophosphatase
MWEYAQSGEEAARLAGHVLRGWSSKFTVREKSRANLVTEADSAAQQAIIEFLSRRYPSHGFLGEEDAADVRPPTAYTWIIDPLDGTTNYVHGFPYFAVSIGLEHEGTLIAGVIYDPSHDDLFVAVKGGGARLNGKPLRVSAIGELSAAMVFASLPVATHPNDLAVQRFLKLLGQAQTVQRTGSAALNLANLAAGRVDGFWSTSLKPWDMAAGVLMVTEAGGRVTSLSGDPFDLHTPSLLATNGTTLHDTLCDALASVSPDTGRSA